MAHVGLFYSTFITLIFHTGNLHNQESLLAKMSEAYPKDKYLGRSGTF